MRKTLVYSLYATTQLGLSACSTETRTIEKQPILVQKAAIDIEPVDYMYETPQTMRQRAIDPRYWQNEIKHNIVLKTLEKDRLAQKLDSATGTIFYAEPVQRYPNNHIATNVRVALVKNRSDTIALATKTYNAVFDKNNTRQSLQCVNTIRMMKENISITSFECAKPDTSYKSYVIDRNP